MKMNHRTSRMTVWALGVSWIFLAAALMPNARGQNPAVPAGPGSGHGRAHFFGAELFSAGKVVTGAPYSAQAVTEHIQTLPDGNTIHTTTNANVYRDSEGRTRREQEIGAIGPWAAAGGPRKVVSIGDPVGGSVYMLNPDSQTAHQMPFPAHLHARRGADATQAKRENPNVKTESLGTQVIAGVTAEGTRTIRTIPAGQVGNQQALVITIERWYSPELQTDVMRKEVNPQFGQTTFQLTNIARVEPEASLFQVPSTYTIKAGRAIGAHEPAERNPVEQ